MITFIEKVVDECKVRLFKSFTIGDLLDKKNILIIKTFEDSNYLSKLIIESKDGPELMKSATNSKLNVDINKYKASDDKARICTDALKPVLDSISNIINARFLACHIDSPLLKATEVVLKESFVSFLMYTLDQEIK